MTFKEKITLENPRDAGNAVEGIIKETEMRRLTVDVLVDTGAWTLVINEETRAKLGLHVMSPSTSEVANGVVESGFLTEPVTIYWQTVKKIPSFLLTMYPPRGSASKPRRTTRQTQKS
jgi:hypothetical protein